MWLRTLTRTRVQAAYQAGVVGMIAVAPPGRSPASGQWMPPERIAPRQVEPELPELPELRRVRPSLQARLLRGQLVQPRRAPAAQLPLVLGLGPWPPEATAGRPEYEVGPGEGPRPELKRWRTRPVLGVSQHRRLALPMLRKLAAPGCRVRGSKQRPAREPAHLGCQPVAMVLRLAPGAALDARCLSSLKQPAAGHERSAPPPEREPRLPGPGQALRVVLK